MPEWLAFCAFARKSITELDGEYQQKQSTLISLMADFFPRKFSALLKK